MMSRVTITVTLCFREETQDKTIIASSDDTASILTNYLSKYAYGGLPVYLTVDRKKIKDNEVIGSFMGKRLKCLPIK